MFADSNPRGFESAPAERGERYQRLARIASGGMASVYLGRALGVGGFERVVAIKVMHPHLAADQEFVTMFLDEVRLAARIRHPNVVATLDVQIDDDVYLVMDYVDGPSIFGMFRALRDRRQRLPVDVALRVLLDALAGLHEAHELRDATGAPLQLIHRDVSPHNVLVGADGIARIADFGIARAEERLSFTSGGKIKGKMTYMAPEQLSGGTVDRRVDVYAAGVVLWECLAARRLFRGEHEAIVAAAILQDPVPWPDEIEPSVPRPIAEVTMRALSRDPSQRYATAADLSDALEGAARESGVGVASTRTVAAFVAELRAHVPVAELLAGAGSAPLLEPPPRASAANLPAPEVGSSTAIASAAPTGSDVRPPRGASRAIWALAFAVGALAMGVGLLVTRMGGPARTQVPPTTPTGPNATDLPLVVTNTVVVREVAPPPPSVAEPAPPRRVEPKPEQKPRDAGAPPSASAAHASHPVASAPPPPTAAPKPPVTAPPGGATNFRPTEP